MSYVTLYGDPDISDSVSVALVGDIMLARRVGKMLASRGPDFPFSLVRDVLEAVDVAIGNLECTVSGMGSPSKESYSRFRADPEALPGLKLFDVLTLANNHVLDYGPEAVMDTVSALTAAGIRAIGVGRSYEEARRPAVLERDGCRIGVLNYTSMRNVTKPDSAIVAAPLSRRDFIDEDIRELRRLADVVIVVAHFGHDQVPYVSPEARDLARGVVDAGADLVIGHHPHVLSGLERYGSGMIYYSLGDFVFDTPLPSRRKTGLFRARVGKTGIQGFDILPLWINEEYQPSPPDASISEEILEDVRRLTAALTDETNDRLFMEQASQEFGEAQLHYLRVLYRRGGVKSLLTHLRDLRPIHLRLGVEFLRGRLRQGWRRRRG